MRGTGVHVGEMDTEAGGTPPTGMHSVLLLALVDIAKNWYSSLNSVMVIFCNKTCR